MPPSGGAYWKLLTLQLLPQQVPARAIRGGYYRRRLTVQTCVARCVQR